jgi:hypothetical protein
MYALEMTEDEVDEHLNSLLLDSNHSNGNGKVAVAAK